MGIGCRDDRAANVIGLNAVALPEAEVPLVRVGVVSQIAQDKIGFFFSESIF